MKRVLVIDDDVKVISQIEEILAADGIRVDKALSGDEGLELARRTLPSLILIDLVMPGTSGFQVCKNIKNEADLEGTPIIMLTLREGAFDPRYTKLFGVVDFLKKPLQPELLKQKVKMFLQERGPEVGPVTVDADQDPFEEADVGLSREDEEALGADEFSETPSGAMFSSMDDISGIPLGPGEAEGGTFQSPISFEEVDEAAVGEERSSPDDETADSFRPERRLYECDRPDAADEAGAAPAAGQPGDEPGSGLPDGEESDAATWDRADVKTAREALDEDMPEEPSAPAESPAEDLDTPFKEGMDSMTDEAPENGAAPWVEPVPAAPESVADSGGDLLDTDLAEGVSAAVNQALARFVAETLPGSLEALRNRVPGEGQAERPEELLEPLRQAVGDEVRGALEEFREAGLSRLLTDGIGAFKPDLDAAVRKAVFEASEEFLSGRFEDIVADRIGAVVLGAGGRSEDKRPAFEGDLAVVGLRTVLEMLETERATGWLSVVGVEYIVDIHVQDGRIRFASSLAAPTETRLGRILLEKKLVDEDTLIVARQEGRRTGKRLGQVLVEVGRISKETLGEILWDQTQRLINRVMGMESGRFLFVAGPLDPEIAGLPCDLSVGEMP